MTQTSMIGALKITLMNAIGSVIAFLVRPCFVAYINRQTFLVRKSNKRLLRDEINYLRKPKDQNEGGSPEQTERSSQRFGNNKVHPSDDNDS